MIKKTKTNYKYWLFLSRMQILVFAAYKFLIMFVLACLITSPAIISFNVHQAYAQSPMFGNQPVPTSAPTPTPDRSINPLPKSPSPTAKNIKEVDRDSDLPKYNGSGVENTIREYLCTPDGFAADEVLSGCIQKLYRFGVTVGALALVFFIVVAGYLYITGGATGKANGKSMIVTTITGMAILLGSYLILSFVNPELVKIKTIQPPIFGDPDLPSCEAIGFSDKCIISTGPDAGTVINPINGGGERGQCTANNMQLCDKWKASEALEVCKLESKGNTAAASSTDKCFNFRGPDGNLLSFSYGLMQVSLKSVGDAISECKNILDYPEGQELRKPGNCPGGWGTAQKGEPYCKARLCSAPRGEAILQKCAKMLTDKETNIKAACVLYSQRCWRPWPDTGKVVNDYKKCPR